MAAIIERTPHTVTVRMSTSRWNRLQQLEKDMKLQEKQQKEKKTKPKYRHEALCGMFKSDATQTELIEQYISEKYDI